MTVSGIFSLPQASYIQIEEPKSTTTTSTDGDFSSAPTAVLDPIKFITEQRQNINAYFLEKASLISKEEELKPLFKKVSLKYKKIGIDYPPKGLKILLDQLRLAHQVKSQPVIVDQEAREDVPAPKSSTKRKIHSSGPNSSSSDNIAPSKRTLAFKCSSDLKLSLSRTKIIPAIEEHFLEISEGKSSEELENIYEQTQSSFRTLTKMNIGEESTKLLLTVLKLERSRGLSRRDT